MIIGSSKAKKRVAHWNHIRKKVRTHEGELLIGEKGRKYQQKYGKKYLGRDVGAKRQMTEDDVRQYERTEK